MLYEVITLAPLVFDHLRAVCLRRRLFDLAFVPRGGHDLSAAQEAARAGVADVAYFSLRALRVGRHD